VGGPYPWSRASDPGYWIGKGTEVKHAYPDSAGTATALTSGTKTYNNSINIDPFGRQVEPIARQLQAQGFAVGVVTSVQISHATPACAYANNVHRSDYQDISRDLLGLPSVAHPVPLPGVDVLLGAGWGETKDQDGAQGDNYVPGNRFLTDSDRQRADVRNGGAYHVVERTAGQRGDELLAAAARDAIDNKQRLLGFFGVAGGHLPYATADGGYNPTGSVNAVAEQYSDDDLAENPRLAQMATTALDVLSSRSDRMWLMIESGDVDWANHSNNIDNSIGAVLSGDEAFLAVAQWIEKNVGWDAAAVLLTADHGHYLVLDRPEALASAESSAP
jgi:alkaline phosphatase